MPELRLVVLALQDRLAYGPNFEAALSSLFGSETPSLTGAEASQSSGAAAPPGKQQPLNESQRAHQPGRPRLRRLSAPHVGGQAGRSRTETRRSENTCSTSSARMQNKFRIAAFSRARSHCNSPTEIIAMVIAMIDRRGFLKTAAAAVPLARAGDSFVLPPAAVEAGSASVAQAASPATSLAANLRRIGQTNFTEHDPAVSTWKRGPIIGPAPK